MSPGTCIEIEALLREGAPDDDPRVRAHLAHCEQCRAEAGDFAELGRLAAALKRPIDDHGMWPRIESALHVEREGPIATPRNAGRKWWLIGPLAAAAIVIALLPWIAGNGAPSPSGMLLDREQVAGLASELSRISTELERVMPQVRERAAAREPEGALVLGRLELLDAHIETCRELQARNALNAGLNRAILGAAQQKIELCRDFLSR